jgi:hypothetical protein
MNAEVYFNITKFNAMLSKKYNIDLSTIFGSKISESGIDHLMLTSSSKYVSEKDFVNYCFQVKSKFDVVGINDIKIKEFSRSLSTEQYIKIETKDLSFDKIKAAHHDMTKKELGSRYRVHDNKKHHCLRDYSAIERAPIERLAAIDAKNYGDKVEWSFTKIIDGRETSERFYFDGSDEKQVNKSYLRFKEILDQTDAILFESKYATDIFTKIFKKTYMNLRSRGVSCPVLTNVQPHIVSNTLSRENEYKNVLQKNNIKPLNNNSLMLSRGLFTYLKEIKQWQVHKKFNQKINADNQIIPIKQSYKIKNDRKRSYDNLDYFSKEKRNRVVSIDLEFNKDIVTEVGISYYKDDKLIAENYLIKEHHDVSNNKRFNFGRRSTVSEKAAVLMLRGAFEAYDCLVFHDHKGDSALIGEMFNKHGVTIPNKRFDVIDTLKVSEYIDGKDNIINYNGHSLKKLLQAHNIQFSNLHNAGNDAYYTLKYAEAVSEIFSPDYNFPKIKSSARRKVSI